MGRIGDRLSGKILCFFYAWCCGVIVLSWYPIIVPSGPSTLISYAKEPSCASLAFALNDPQVSSSSVARDRRRQLTRV